MYYRSRHPHVATIVFERALPTPEEKFDLLADLSAVINIDYSSDRETFSRLIEGRGIVEIFPKVELGRLFYDRLEESFPNDAFIYHQRAVFEINHAAGSLQHAESSARRAFELNPNNRSIQHTQGDVARRLANETDDPLRKRALRRIAREKLGGELSRASEYDLYTRGRLALDELREQLTSPEALSQDARAARFVEVVKDAEIVIQRGLQSFPDSSEILSVGASFRDLLNQTAAAGRALERAFHRNPRLDWLAVRLARPYSDASDWTKSLGVLDKCLQDNPGSKIANMEYALILMRAKGSNASIIDHLRRSFSDGDNQFDAQFWYGRELFLQRQFPAAASVFQGLNDRAPGRFRNQATAPAEGADGSLIAYSARIERFEDGYSFVRIASFPMAIFASRAESDAEPWKGLKTGSLVTCSLAFNRRGARATNVRPA
jgi:tetratricopeptide (TPR) repeat protein